MACFPCSSCQILSRGLVFRRTSSSLSLTITRLLTVQLLSRQNRKFSNIRANLVKNHFGRSTFLPSQAIKKGGQNRSLFISSAVFSKIGNSSNDTESEKPAKIESNDVNFEESLTEEERQVLKEIEDEERRLRGEDWSPNDYSIWDEDKSSKKLAGSLAHGHKRFKDQTRIIQDVIEEMWNPLPAPEEEEEEEAPIYPRGKTGVFDLGELVDLLREEHGEEIVVITIPKEFDYADHMVIVTVRNSRHLVALATFVRKRFKMKELKRTDAIPFLDRKANYNGWIALDLGNIILQVFQQEVRDYYDLETLWTVGPMYDDLSNIKDSEIVQLLNSLQNTPSVESQSHNA